MQSINRVGAAAGHATVEQVCGPFGPYQEIVAGVGFAARSVVQGVRGMWAAIRAHDWSKGHRSAA